jgi:hypothetical protein
MERLQMAKDLTVLEEIIGEVAEDVYNKWALALPEEQKTDDALSALSKNAYEVTVMIIQNFMKRFNEAAEELKDK